MKLTMTGNADATTGYIEWVNETGQKYMLRFDFTRFLENYCSEYAGRLWAIERNNDNIVITIDDDFFKGIAKTELIKKKVIE